MNDIMENFLAKINNGYDGLIRSILITGFDQAEVIISAMDAENGHDWINVKFVLTGLKECKVFQKARTSNVVLSSGIKYFFDNSLHYLDFLPYSDDMDSVDDVRRSDFYFGCVGIEYKIQQYAEM